MIGRIFLGMMVGGLFACFAVAQPANRISLTLDSSEAEAVLVILDKRALHERVTDADWQRVFTTTPYRRLKQHEASMPQPFTDQEFIKFLDTLDASREQLRQVLREWQSVDLQAVAQRPLAYLPAQATIRAEVYPMIDAKPISFVFEPDAPAPAIFLYVDPKTKTREQLKSTFAHEAHHLGLASVQTVFKREISSLPENARKAAWWMGNFREGTAVLAAAGSPDVHPMSVFPEPIQRTWDLEAEHFADNVEELNQFFLDTLHGDLRNDAVLHESRVFFGYGVGPWYTVGYRMAVTIEREFGRTALVATYADPRQFVARYNEAAEAENAKNGGNLPLFSAEILKAVEGENR
jgi:Putative zinc dependent peptidase (DUF5700)